MQKNNSAIDSKWMSPVQQTQKFFEFLALADLDAAREVLEAHSWDSHSDERARLHYLGQLYMNAGEFAQAIVIMEEARQKLGDHVLLMADLAACYYVELNMADFRRLLNELQAAVLRFESKISPETLCRVSLLLGKFLEEEGEIAIAIALFNKAQVCASALKSTELALQVDLNLLRVISQFRLRGDLSLLYMRTLKLVEQQPDFSRLGEIEHGLMQAEIALFGLEHGRSRLIRVLQDSRLSDYNRSLMYFDFIEAVLMEEKKRHLIPKYEPASDFSMNAYEKGLHQLAQSSVAYESVYFSSLLSQIPLTQYLKLGLMSARFLKDGALREEMNRKSDVLLNSLSSESQLVWRSRFGGELRYRQVEILVELKTEIVRCPSVGFSMSLKRKAALFQLLCVLCSGPEISMEKIAAEVWEMDLNDSVENSLYDRTRVSVKRLNDMLLDLTGDVVLFEVTKSSVKVNTNFKLTLS